MVHIQSSPCHLLRVLFCFFANFCAYPPSRVSSLHFPHHGRWGGLHVSGQRRAAEAGDFPPPWGLSHCGKYDRLRHLCFTQGRNPSVRISCFSISLKRLILYSTLSYRGFFYTLALSDCRSLCGPLEEYFQCLELYVMQNWAPLSVNLEPPMPTS